MIFKNRLRTFVQNLKWQQVFWIFIRCSQRPDSWHHGFLYLHPNKRKNIHPFNKKIKIHLWILFICYIFFYEILCKLNQLISHFYIQLFGIQINELLSSLNIGSFSKSSFQYRLRNIYWVQIIHTLNIIVELRVARHYICVPCLLLKDRL